MAKVQDSLGLAQLRDASAELSALSNNYKSGPEYVAGLPVGVHCPAFPTHWQSMMHDPSLPVASLHSS
jgi:hypothetical protein